jgi:uncharacterized alkaline shock family protein YloU
VGGRAQSALDDRRGRVDADLTRATAAVTESSNSFVEGGHALPSSLGRITISSGAIAQIVAQTAAECYGVVAMSARNRAARLLSRARETQGITIGGNGRGVEIELYVVVEYGLNLAEVAATLRSRVTYEIERLTGLHVASVEVHIEDVKKSA